jgi:hypothetical protein
MARRAGVRPRPLPVTRGLQSRTASARLDPKTHVACPRVHLRPRICARIANPRTRGTTGSSRPCDRRSAAARAPEIVARSTRRHAHLFDEGVFFPWLVDWQSLFNFTLIYFLPVNKALLGGFSARSPGSAIAWQCFSVANQTNHDRSALQTSPIRNACRIPTARNAEPARSASERAASVTAVRPGPARIKAAPSR